VNEIFAGFGNFDFTVVAIGRTATAKKQACNVVCGWRVWQPVNQLG
jgi:hypothetical protein